MAKKKNATSKMPTPRGRPPKNDAERTVSRLAYPCNAKEAKVLKDGAMRLEDETGHVFSINRQQVIRLLIRRLGDELKNKEFSMREAYLNGE